MSDKGLLLTNPEASVLVSNPVAGNFVAKVDLRASTPGVLTGAVASQYLSSGNVGLL